MRRSSRLTPSRSLSEQRVEREAAPSRFSLRDGTGSDVEQTGQVGLTQSAFLSEPLEAPADATQGPLFHETDVVPVQLETQQPSLS